MHTSYDDLNFTQISLFLISTAHFLTYHLLSNILHNARYESKYIKEITTRLFKRLNYKCLYVGDNLDGMDSYLRELTLKLKIHSNDDVRIVGFWWNWQDNYCQSYI